MKNLFLVIAILCGYVALHAKVAVLLVNNDGREPFTVEQARAETEIANQFFREASFSRVSFEFDIYDWRTIQYTGCDRDAIANNALATIDASRYDIFIFTIPHADCGFAAAARRGVNWIWVNEWFEYALVNHEMGHIFGLWHSRSYAYEYGDPFDVMGGGTTGGNSPHFNAYHKDLLGWITPQLIDQSGTYRLNNYSTGHALKIFRSPDPNGGELYYYVEKRTAFGFDSILSIYPQTMRGVLIHTGSSSPGSGHIYLEDATPETATMADSALDIGQTYSDGNVSITLNSSDESGADVTITGAVPAPTPSPTPQPTATPCVKMNPRGKCIK